MKVRKVFVFMRFGRFEWLGIVERKLLIHTSWTLQGPLGIPGTSQAPRGHQDARVAKDPKPCLLADTIALALFPTKGKYGPGALGPLRANRGKSSETPLNPKS